MTPEEFKRLQAEAGLTNAELARYLGVEVRTVERYRAGQRKIPGPVAKLMERLRPPGA